MKIECQTEQGVVIVSLHGRLDALSADYLRNSFYLWLVDNNNFIFNCKDLEFIDSSGLGVFISCLRRAMENDGDVMLAALNPRTRMIFEITRAQDIFTIYPTVAEALAHSDTG